MRHQSLFAVLFAVVFFAVIGVSLVFASQQLQPAPDRFRSLIEGTSAAGKGFTIEFAVALSTGERRRDFTHEPLRVGDDYFCFGEPWNDGLRFNCTPFANIVSLTFLE